MSSFVKYADELEAMLLRRDVAAYREFAEKWGLRAPANDLVAEAAMHKAITSLTRLPENVRGDSRKWLSERGFTHWGDDA